MISLFKKHIYALNYFTPVFLTFYEKMENPVASKTL